MNFRNNNSKWKTYKGIVNNEEKVRDTLEGGTELESGPPDIFISVSRKQMQSTTCNYLAFECKALYLHYQACLYRCNGHRILALISYHQV